MTINPHDLHRRLVDTGEAWADAQAAAELLEETRKVVIAQLMADSPEHSATAKEAWALRQEAYQKHITGMVQARKAANRAKVQYESAKVFCELLRTQNANERAANRHAT